jgi:hypothetical protein
MLSGRFAATNPSMANDSDYWQPIVRVSLSNSTDVNSTNIVKSDAIALIDTGSTLCIIDEDILQGNNFSFIKETATQSAGGLHKTRLYSAQFVTGEGSPLQLNCLSVPIRKMGNSFDVILGMDLIRFFELSVVRRRDQVTLLRIQ